MAHAAAARGGAPRRGVRGGGGGTQGPGRVGPLDPAAGAANACAIWSASTSSACASRCRSRRRARSNTRRPGAREPHPTRPSKAAVKGWEGSRWGGECREARARARLRQAAALRRAARPRFRSRATAPSMAGRADPLRRALAALVGSDARGRSRRPGHDRPSAARPEARPFDLCGPLPTGTTVLEASAGTGKTYTIAALVTRFVAEGVAGLDQMLIVTFSRAATGELRERVRERLTSAELGLADPAAARDATDPLLALLADAADDEVALRRERLTPGAHRLRRGHHRHHASVLRAGAGRARGHRRARGAHRRRPVRRVAGRSGDRGRRRPVPAQVRCRRSAGRAAGHPAERGPADRVGCGDPGAAGAPRAGCGRGGFAGRHAPPAGRGGPAGSEPAQAAAGAAQLRRSADRSGGGADATRSRARRPRAGCASAFRWC